MLPPFFSFYLSSPSGIATCAALHASRKFRRQHCSQRIFQNFSSVFREILKGKDCLV
jgi:hypothetical protein